MYPVISDSPRMLPVGQWHLPSSLILPGQRIHPNPSWVAAYKHVNGKKNCFFFFLNCWNSDWNYALNVRCFANYYAWISDMELSINCTYRLVNRTLLTGNGRCLSDDSLETMNANAAQSCKRIEKGTQLKGNQLPHAAGLWYIELVHWYICICNNLMFIIMIMHMKTV